jgi:hypothetical protein
MANSCRAHGRIFSPAYRVTPAGFVWAALGFFLLGGMVSLVRQVFGMMRRRRRGSAPIFSQEG